MAKITEASLGDSVSQNVPKWTSRQWEVIRWFAADNYHRMPESQTALAAKLGLNRKTICRWKKLDGFWDSVNELAREKFKRDIAQYYAALNREARKGNFQHLRLALEMSGEVSELGTEDNPQVNQIRVVYDDA